MAEQGEHVNTDRLNNKIKQDVANLFKAFSSLTRIDILFLLKNQPLTVTEISQALDMSQSAISHQLKELKMARLVAYKRQGRKIIYELDDHHIHDIFDMAIEHVKETYNYE